MGERANGVSAIAMSDGAAADSSPREAARRLDGEIGELREELSGLIGELDRRRHELLDVKLQVRRHALGVTLSAVALITAASGLVWFGMWRAQRRARLLSRAGRLREAVSRMVDRPERVAAEPTLPGKILGAAAAAAAATLVKKGLERAVHMTLERRGTGGTAGSAAARRGVTWPARSGNGGPVAVTDVATPDVTSRARAAAPKPLAGSAETSAL
jgi:hypothetical protein